MFREVERRAVHDAGRSRPGARPTARSRAARARVRASTPGWREGVSRKRWSRSCARTRRSSTPRWSGPPRCSMGRDGHRPRRGSRRGGGRAARSASAHRDLAGYKVPKRFLAVDALHRGPWRASPTTGACASFARAHPCLTTGSGRCRPSRSGRPPGLRRRRSGGRRRRPPHVRRRRRRRPRATRGRHGAGVRPGDRVAVWAPNSWEWIVAALGGARAGAWLVPLNTRFKGDEAAYVLDQANARRAVQRHGEFLDTDYVACCTTRRRDLRCLDDVVLLAGARDDDAGWTVPRRRRHGRRGRRAHGRVERSPPTTSATSSSPRGRRAPKGVMLEHGQPPRRTTIWSATLRLARGRPLPGREPVLPLLRVQGGMDDRA